MIFSEQINPSSSTKFSLFSTPESLGKLDHHTPIEKRILGKLFELKEIEKLNPQDNLESRYKFHEIIDWTDTLLTDDKKRDIEKLLVDYHDIFAAHRMDIGMNTELKMKPNPLDDKRVYNQNMSMPIILNKNLTVELALMQR